MGSLSNRCIIGVHVVIGAAVIRCNSSAHSDVDMMNLNEMKFVKQ